MFPFGEHLFWVYSVQMLAYIYRRAFTMTNHILKEWVVEQWGNQKRTLLAVGTLK